MISLAILDRTRDTNQFIKIIFLCFKSQIFIIIILLHFLGKFSA